MECDKQSNNLDIDTSGSLTRGNNGRDFNASQIAIKPRIKGIQVSILSCLSALFGILYTNQRNQFWDHTSA
jgi:hypothetical protein